MLHLGHNLNLKLLQFSRLMSVVDFIQLSIANVSYDLHLVGELLLLPNESIDLDIQAGEIHALLGENGAGKSTLVKIIYGVLRPDHGDLWWQGKPLRVASPAAARRVGIGMVGQQFSLFAAMSPFQATEKKIDDRPLQRIFAARPLQSKPAMPSLSTTASAAST